MTTWNRGQYMPVHEDGTEKQSSDPDDDEKFAALVKKRSLLSMALTVIALSFAFGSIFWLFEWARTPASEAIACKQPAIRREWRTLTVPERQEFLKAVNCLATVPSQWTHNGTLYDDYAFLHGSIGGNSHRSASFLPWHRWTLFLWENSLKEHCGFAGSIPYWDWRLDWMDLAGSSIWNAEHGFGGDGEDGFGGDGVGNGSCVADGPFINLRPILYNNTYIAHCLCRGFNDKGRPGRLSGTRFSPTSMGKITRKETFREFSKELEERLHNTLHEGIAGDFLSLTAANDPIFFVHHAQLDHMWWRWQKEDPHRRLHDYEGKSVDSTVEGASLADMLPYGGFSEDLPVLKVMSTESANLCYRYE